MRRPWLLLAALFALSLVVTSWAAGCASGGQDDDTTADDDDDVAPTIDANEGTGQCAHCTSTEKCCGGFCLDVRSNRNNCGDCDITCEPLTSNECSGGQCTCNFGPECTGGEECCDTGCKDLQQDELNCGDCGTQCGVNEACVGGHCVCAGTGAACAEGTSCCSSGCVNLLEDKDNCGDCDMPCPSANSTCEGGMCGCSLECPAIALLPGCCDDGCFDLCSDLLHCGSCDAAPCETCLFGVCLDVIDPTMPPVPPMECLALPI